jgi:hypothetical protein
MLWTGVHSHGPSFGPGGIGFARLNFATSEPILKEILRRLGRRRRAAHRRLEKLFIDDRHALRERVFWRLAYETALNSYSSGEPPA